MGLTWTLYRGEADGNIENFLIYYIAGNFETGNSFNFVVIAVVGQHSVLPCNVHRFFCNVARSEILAGNSFIVRCHVVTPK